MGYEIDFLPVGDGSTSGDAIALRYGNLFGDREEQRVMIIDGGFADDGEALVKHLDTYYGTDQVDVVVCTHPDRDHVGGLKVVLETLNVGEFWMHLPWAHSRDMALAKARTGFRSTHLAKRVQAALQGAVTLEEIALQRGIVIREPFTGTSTDDGAYVVLGPSVDYYEELLAEFPEIPEKKAAGVGLLAKAAEALAKKLPETDLIETLTDLGETPAQNNSSVIGLLRSEQYLALLTADAGMPALEQAASMLEMGGFQPGSLAFIQVPHHGSRRNVGPTILSRFLGPKGVSERVGSAFVSVAPDGAPKHPAKKVTNGFRRRGYPVNATQGNSVRHHRNAPSRGWSKAEPLPFYDFVEED